MAITKTNRLNMTGGGVPVIVRLSQYDDDFTLVFELYSTDGTFTIPSGTTAEVRGTKNDGKGYSASAALDITNKKVTVTGDQQMTAVPGKHIFELTLWKSNKELNSANFILDVEPAALDRNTIVSESKIMELLDVTDRADEILEAADLVENVISDVTEVESKPLDKSLTTKLAAYVYPSTNSIKTKDDCSVIYFACRPGFTYTINKIVSARFRVAYTKTLPANDVPVFGLVADNTATSLSVTAGTDAAYVVVYYYDGTNDTLSEATIYDSISITYGRGLMAVDKAAREDKVDKQQSPSDVGKVLVVGSDGILKPIDIADGISDAARLALLNCFTHVAWIDDQGQTAYNALEAALFADTFPKITASFSPGLNVIYTDTSLDTLKQYLTVKYYATKGSTGVVLASTDYTLFGTLVEGDNIIGVNYQNLATTFTVNDVIDFYNIWERSMASGSLTKVTGSADTNQSDTTMYPSRVSFRSDVTTRRNINVSKGLLPYYAYNQQAVATPYYPVPVPDGANHLKITIEPVGQYIYANFVPYDPTTNTYGNGPAANRISWTQITANGLEHNLNRTEGKKLFMVASLKYDSAGTSYPVEPTNLTIEFSEV